LVAKLASTPMTNVSPWVMNSNEGSFRRERLSGPDTSPYSRWQRFRPWATPLAPRDGRGPLRGPDDEEAILSPYVIGRYSSTTTGCGKFPSGQNPPIFPQNITSPTACPTSAALESLLPTQTGLPVQRTPPLAPGDLIPWSRPQDVAPLPAYCTRSTVFIRTHIQGEPKPFSALWVFGVPG